MEQLEKKEKTNSQKEREELIYLYFFNVQHSIQCIMVPQKIAGEKRREERMSGYA